MASKSRKANTYKRGDRFTKQAKDEGYKARSVFKLAEVQRRYPIFRSGQRVVDLGCFPGSWSQYALQCIGRKGVLVGVDLEPTKLGGGHWLQADIFDVPAAQIAELLGGPADVVLSDMAPRTVGVPFTDHVRQMELVRQALEVAVATLAPGGTFVVKVFDGEEVPAFQEAMRSHFDKTKRIRPEAVRRESREFYLIGLGFTPRGEDAP